MKYLSTFEPICIEQLLKRWFLIRTVPSVIQISADKPKIPVSYSELISHLGQYLRNDAYIEVKSC